jgi:hypothetical protein
MAEARVMVAAMAVVRAMALVTMAGTAGATVMAMAAVCLVPTEVAVALAMQQRSQRKSTKVNGSQWQQHDNKITTTQQPHDKQHDNPQDGPRQQPTYREKAKATVWSFAVRHFPDVPLLLPLSMCCYLHLHHCLNVPWRVILGMIAVDC